jgi:succinyl-CoA synthetase alpha subunit
MPSETLIDTRYLGGMKTAASKYTTLEKANINIVRSPAKLGELIKQILF